MYLTLFSQEAMFAGRIPLVFFLVFYDSIKWESVIFLYTYSINMYTSIYKDHKCESLSKVLQHYIWLSEMPTLNLWMPCYLMVVAILLPEK